MTSGEDRIEITMEAEATARTGDGYHHGDLPNALRRAAVGVIDERGLGAFSLREVARRAGVSHTAPAHHFGDVRGLLTSLAREGFDALHDAVATAGAGVDDPVDRLAAIGEAYVELARSHHAHCEVMFRTDVVDPDDPDLQAAGERAYRVLEDTVREVIDTEGLEVDLDDAVWLCWSAMQGLVVLGPKLERIAELRGRPAVPTGELVRRFTDLMVNGLRGARPRA
jgi:AcrR family transcriptional regulator